MKVSRGPEALSHTPYQCAGGAAASAAVQAPDTDPQAYRGPRARAVPQATVAALHSRAGPLAPSSSRNSSNCSHTTAAGRGESGQILALLHRLQPFLETTVYPRRVERI